MEDKKCYMCDRIATTVEHVPPRCMFPERKDIGENYRKDLITVPSCEEHNLNKSDDDEFLMTFISGYIKNNTLGYFHTKTKLRRSVTRNQHLIDRVLKDVKSVTIKTDSGSIFHLLEGEPNIGRLTKCIEYISHGLYFHEFGFRFNGYVTVIYEFVRYADPTIDKVRADFVGIYEEEVDMYPVKGANPKVFFYQITPPNSLGVVGLRITFFEGTHFLVSMKVKNDL